MKWTDNPGAPSTRLLADFMLLTASEDAWSITTGGTVIAKGPASSIPSAKHRASTAAKEYFLHGLHDLDPKGRKYRPANHGRGLHSTRPPASSASAPGPLPSDERPMVESLEHRAWSQRQRK